MHYLDPQVLAALEFAAVAHKNQNRKFPDYVPYISHPAAVGLILSKAGFGVDVVVAGILHDVLEDTERTAAHIEQKFGSNVLRLVEAVTEAKSSPWQDRKDAYLAHLATASDEIKAISGADLLANRSSDLLGLEAGIDPWKSFSKDPAAYVPKIFAFDHARLALIKNTDKPLPFIEELEEVCRRMEELTELTYKI